MRKFGSFLLLLCVLQFSCVNSEGQGNPETEQQQKKEAGSKTPQEEPSFQTSPAEIKNALEKKGAENAFFEQEVLQSFYADRNYEPAWKDKDQRNVLLMALKAAEEEGLSFADYHEQEITRLQENAENPTDAASLDLLLTDAFLKYARHLYYGKTDPEKIHKLWGVKRQKKDFKALLNKGLKNEEIQVVLEAFKPQHQIYGDLKTALKEYAPQKEDSLQSKQIPEGKLIRPGEKDERLAVIMKRLQEKGYAQQKMLQDSVYSAALQDVIKEFQKERGLKTDGIIGNSTIKELNMSPADRHQQILVNLERWRWYPRDLGEHYILINIANFRLAVVNEGDTIREHKVVAGTRARQTPTFTDTLQYIVINPEWHIPPTIKKQDVIPRAAKDPNYISSHNMKVYDNGKRLDPSKIDWSSREVRSYSFVQTSGPSNPLGRVKIIYPNKYLIYLHDTPAQSLFGQNQRAESSGCVRVENAVELAGYVIDGQEDWNEEKIREVINSGKTTKVKIHRPIQVHHFYWTAWRDGGKTVFSPDVYDLDKKIYTALLED